MNRYQSSSEYGLRSHHDHILDTISDYRFFAPVKMAMDESHDRLLAEASRSRALTLSEPAVGTPPLVDTVRYRLGQRFIRLGTMLCRSPQFVPSA